MVYLGDEGVIYYWYFIFLGNNLVFVGNIFLFFGIEESDIYYVEVCRGGCVLDCIFVNIQVNNLDVCFILILEVVYLGILIQFFVLNMNLGIILFWDWGDNMFNGQFLDMQYIYLELGIYEVMFIVVVV